VLYDAVGNGPGIFARHVIGHHFTPDTRARNALDDAAGNFLLVPTACPPLV